jgi:hypothetical protein
MRLRLGALVILVAAVAAAVAVAVWRTGAEGPVPAAARADAETAKPKAARTSDGVAIDQRWPTGAELRWLDRYARWEPGLFRAADEAFASLDDGEPEAARAAARPFARCARELPAGRPPSKRLALFAKHVRAACAAVQRAVRIATAAGAYGTGSRERRVDFEVEQAGRSLTAAHGMLPLGARRKLPVRGGRTEISRVEPHFSRAAGEVAQFEEGLEVRCWSAADWKRLISQSIRLGHGGEDVLGFVVGPGGSRIHLSPELCTALVLTVYGEPRGAAAEVRAGEALLALAHEAQHSAGVANEAKATCHALQTVSELAYALELRKPLIERLVERYWRHAMELPAEYRSKECREGGELDLTPNDGAWP